MRDQLAILIWAGILIITLNVLAGVAAYKIQLRGYSGNKDISSVVENQTEAITIERGALEDFIKTGDNVILKLFEMISLLAMLNIAIVLVSGFWYLKVKNKPHSEN